MPSRRQEKFSRAIKKAVSSAIAEGLNDPRIEGLVSVTRVEMTADLRGADVYLSIFGGDEGSHRRTFSVLEHARSRIQTFVARELTSKFCPVIQLKYDEAFKKSLETMRILNEVKQPDDE